MKLLLDANISWRIAKPLRLHYENLAHILDFFNHDEDDIKIWDYATKEGYTIVSNDEDFMALSSTKGWPPKVILLKTGNQSNEYLKELLVNKKADIEAFINQAEWGMLIIR